VQQWASGVVQSAQNRTEHQEDCAALARPTPSLTHARLAQPCLVEHGQQMLLGMQLCNYATMQLF